MSVLKGSELRDEIARTLRFKYTHVETEKRLVATTADVFFVENSGIFHQKVGIEAKDWKKPLSSGDLAGIERLYSSSISNGEIDYLWIVSRHPLASSQNETIRRMSKVKYSTLEEFRSSLMNFEGLLQKNITAFDLDDAAKNFVPARMKGTDRPLLSEVKDWMSGKQSGLMIYGGYGIGKTTFSYHLANVFSREYRSGALDRVPIRISLGGVFTKQDLPSLVCSNLLGGEVSSYVPGFNFGLFMEANREGQFLIILDGFDEMRHAMDLDEFIFTFNAFRPLFQGNAKIVILGRPDSFLNNRDEDQILSALFDRRVDKDASLHKVEVSYFSKTEVQTYLSNFIAGRGEPLNNEEKGRYDSMIQALPDEEESILSRPIQLKMFTSLLDEYLENDEVLTRYSIYERFIYRFVRREQKKSARRYSTDEVEDRQARVEFMQAVAWWLISEKRDNKFLPSDIPLSIIPKFSKKRAEPETAVREAIVGSVIEPMSEQGVIDRKANRYYYFPHKSYIEFLVAQYFATQLFSKALYVELLKNMNPEILSFIEEGPMSGVENLRNGLGHMLGPADFRLIEVCSSRQDIAKEITKADSYGSTSDVYVHYAYLRQQRGEIASYMIRRLARTRSLSVLSALVNVAGTLAADGLDISFMRALLVNCISSLSVVRLMAALVENSKQSVFHADLDGYKAALLINCTSFAKKNKGILISIDRMLQFAQSTAKGTLQVTLPTLAAKRARELEIPISAMEEVLDSSHLEFLRHLSKNEKADRSWPFLLQGEALSRFG